MASGKHRYLQFPLSYLRDAFDDTKATMKRCMVFGIYNYAQKLPADPDRIAWQIIYELYRGKLPTGILAEIEKTASELGQLDPPFDSTGAWEPKADEVQELKQAFDSNVKLFELAAEYWRVHEALRFMGLSADKEYILCEGKRLLHAYQPGDPMPMLKASTLLEFNQQDKTEYDVAELCMYAAIRSSIGKKDYIRTNRLHLVARMFGYAGKNQVPESKPALYRKYLNRYHFDKVLAALRDNWGIVQYAHHTRGMYLAAGKMSLENLALKAESSKQAYKAKQRKAATTAARDRALEQLRNPQKQ